ncbi:MAG: septal ring lytic transglycosylase RlpA family protein [Saccharospirillaceae bacterium]|nr:septal ring lytic transglycosylase RlpA family protein [Saccharospirillaceae bacterium]MCD8530518.1 septal ring lytic transglycosylase RlpA family protein [Saccharospirillaceae bacterium]
MKPALLLLTLILALTGCTTSRYQHANDFTPVAVTDIHALPEPEPKTEPRSSMGNPRSYKVLGKEYQVMDSADHYKERGIASWYGMKFHGHRTSNGEIYDVYQFTAAHKTLPLPSYVRVTRVDNGQAIIVRVNDRGPFHEGRIIDLSYAAAVKLGIHKMGTAQVDVEIVKPPHTHSVRWVQVSALSDAAAARRLQESLQQSLAPMTWPVNISSQDDGSGLHKVRIGPVPEGDDLNAVLERLIQLNIHQPLLLATHQL